VKSNFEPVVFEGADTVRWLIEHPLPLFLCVVDKETTRLSVYHTLPRFYARSLGQWPEKLELIPERPVAGREGRNTQWTGSYSFSLDQPILDFTVTQMQDNEFWDKLKTVFAHWLEIEIDNLARVQAKLLKFRMPASYRTNEPRTSGWIEGWFGFPNPDQFEQTASGLKESLEWIGEQYWRRKDFCGAAKAALLHRHLFPDERGGPLGLALYDLNGRLAKTDYLYAGVDHLGKLLENALNGCQTPTPKTPEENNEAASQKTPEDEYARRIKAAKSLEEMYAVMETAPPLPEGYDLCKALNANRKVTGERILFPETKDGNPS
jgi:hypothetical protein